MFAAQAQAQYDVRNVHGFDISLLSPLPLQEAGNQGSLGLRSLSRSLVAHCWLPWRWPSLGRIVEMSVCARRTTRARGLSEEHMGMGRVRYAQSCGMMSGGVRVFVSHSVIFCRGSQPGRVICGHRRSEPNHNVLGLLPPAKDKGENVTRCRPFVLAPNSNQTQAVFIARPQLSRYVPGLELRAQVWAGWDFLPPCLRHPQKRLNSGLLGWECHYVAL
jgi:hypothetical protein